MEYNMIYKIILYHKQELIYLKNYKYIIKYFII